MLLNGARDNQKDKLFIIGGASIYKQVLDAGFVDEIKLNIINGKFQGDTKFPLTLSEINKNFVFESSVILKPHETDTFEVEARQYLNRKNNG